MNTASILTQSYRKMVFGRNNPFLVVPILVLIWFAAGLGCPPQSRAIEIDCDLLLSADAANRVQPEMIREIQKKLRSLKYDPGDLDGKLGDHTKTALRRYCRERGHESEHWVTYQLTAEDVEDLKDKEVPDIVIENLQVLVGLEYIRKHLFISAFTENAFVPNQYRSLILEKSEKKYIFDETKSIQWSGGTCGCLLDDLSGVVYGLYPFWMAGGEQQLDFSVLSRIGYFALSFDSNGRLNTYPQWIQTAAPAIKKARKYRTAVDVVIYQKDWTGWSVKTSQALIANIIAMVESKMTDTFSKIKPVLSFGGSPTPTIADGITLYFDGYPEDNDSKELYVSFVLELRKKLGLLRRHYSLNLMLPLEAIGKGIFDVDMLNQFVPGKPDGKAALQDRKPVDNLLVFIDEPTQKTKKELRNRIEGMFTGLQRRTMLRKIIPIISPMEDYEQQFEDDLIYFDDNFGGVGLWTLPISDGSGPDLMTCVKEILPGQKKAASEPNLAALVNANLKEHYRQAGAQAVSGFENFVTLHRWGWRILFDILLAIIAVYALLALSICWFRTQFVNFFWFFMAYLIIFVGVFFSLLYFDPSWRKLAEGNLVLLAAILIACVIAIFGFIRRTRQAQQP